MISSSFKRLFLLVLITLLLLVPLNAQFRKGRGGGAKAPVRANLAFGKVEAVSDGNGVYLKWQTRFETRNLGFDVFRYSNGRWNRVNRALVPGGSMRPDPEASFGREYSFFDPKGDFGAIYRIRATSFEGVKLETPQVFPRFEPNFSRIAGSTSYRLQLASKSAKPRTSGTSPVLSSELRQEIENATLPPDITKQHWVAAQPGVKIGVKSDGLFRVSKAELSTAGFDVNTDPAFWQLYHNGVQQSMIVDPNGDFIEFIGKGIDTPHTDTNIYFLVSGPAPGNRIGSTFRRRVGGRVRGISYPSSFYRKDRNLYIASILNGPMENFFGEIVSPTVNNIQFDLDNVDFGASKAASVRLGIQGFTSTAHTVMVSLNGSRLAALSFNGQEFAVSQLDIATSLLVEGTNTLSLVGVSGPADLSVVESIRVNYRRKFSAPNDQLLFTTENMKETVVTGFSDPAVRVFDLTFGDSPRLITSSVTEPETKAGSTYKVQIASNRSALMFAVADSAVKTADSIAVNSPSALSSTSNTADLVIISYKDWMTEAGDWASYRQSDGFDTELIDVEDVFDEFGFGMKSPDAIKDFIEFAHSNWIVIPNYVLIIGDATYDPRNFTGSGFLDFVPTELIDTAFEETGSDEALTDFDDDGLADVAVGRVPATSAAQVTEALAKVTSFEQIVSQASARGFLCASDRPDAGIFDYEALCVRVQAELPGTIPLFSVNRAEQNAKTNLITSMNEGRYLVNYSGHGSTTSWTSGGFFENGDVNGLTNQNELSVYTMLTCLNGYFVEPGSLSLSEKLFQATNGGAVASWSSSGKTTPDVQEVLARRFYNQLGAGSILRLGDLVMDAKANLQGGRDVRLSWTLLGDPALKMH